MQVRKTLLALAATLVVSTAFGGSDTPAWPPVPTVIAHRGASALRPEHTLARTKRRLTTRQPDRARSGHHPRRGAGGAARERHCHPQHRWQRRVRPPPMWWTGPSLPPAKPPRPSMATPITGWFVEDFTLAELRTLRARERIPAIRPANVAYNGQFEVPTLQEVIDLAKAQSAAKGRTIGVIPETKHRASSSPSASRWSPHCWRCWRRTAGTARTPRCTCSRLKWPPQGAAQTKHGAPGATLVQQRPPLRLCGGRQHPDLCRHGHGGRPQRNCHLRQRSGCAQGPGHPRERRRPGHAHRAGEGCARAEPGGAHLDTAARKRLLARQPTKRRPPPTTRCAATAWARSRCSSRPGWMVSSPTTRAWAGWRWTA